MDEITEAILTNPDLLARAQGMSDSPVPDDDSFEIINEWPGGGE